MARRTKAEAEQTREDILDAAEGLFAERGVGATSLEDVARAAGVTRGAVYWHFKDKVALFEALYRRAKQPLEQSLENVLTSDDPLGSLRASCLYAIRHMTSDPHASRIFEIMNFRCQLAEADAQRCSWQQKNRDDALKKFERAFTRAKKQGQLEAGITPRLAAMGLMAMIGGLLKSHSEDAATLNLKRNAPRLLDIFFAGLSA